MEQTAAKESNSERSGPLGLTSSSRRLMFDLNSVANCEHFSIRGYVAGVRKNNWTKCWPFSVPKDCDKLKDYPDLLPPLTVPKFRWWDCQSCFNISNDSTIEGVDTNSTDDTQIPNVVSHEVPSRHNSPDWCSTFGNKQRGNISRRFEVDLNASISIEKDTDEDRVSLDLNRPLCSISSDETVTAAKPVAHELDAFGDGEVMSRGNDVIEMDKKDRASQGIYDRLNLESPELVGGGVAEHSNKDDLGFSGENLALVDPGTQQEIGFGTKEGKSPNAVVVPMNDINLIEKETLSTISNGTIARKKPRKMRSLSEVFRNEMGEENDGNIIIKDNSRKQKCGVDINENSLVTRRKISPKRNQRRRGGEQTEQIGSIIISSETNTGSNDRTKILGKKRNKMTQCEDCLSPLTHGGGISKNLKISVPGEEIKHIDKMNAHECIASKKGKAPKVDDLNFLPKDYIEISDDEDFPDFQKHRKAPKHNRPAQRNEDTRKEIASDDIPMDIVELLARNQLGRSLPNAKEDIERRKETSGTTSNTMPSQIKVLTGKVMENSGKELSYPSGLSRKVNNIDLNASQPEISCAPKGFVPWSQSRKKPSQVPPPPSLNIRDPGKYCIQFLEECRRNLMVSQRNLIQQAQHDGVSLHSVPPAVGIKFSQPNDSLQLKRGENVTEADKELFSSYSFSSKGKDKIYHPKVVDPRDKTIPALNFRRLIDQGAFSSTPTTIPTEKNKSKLVQQPPSSSYCHRSKLFEIETSGIPKGRGIQAASFDQGAFSSTPTTIPTEKNKSKLVQQSPPSSFCHRSKLFEIETSGIPKGRGIQAESFEGIYPSPEIGSSSGLPTPLKQVSTLEPVSSAILYNSNNLGKQPIGFTDEFSSGVVAPSKRQWKDQTKSPQSFTLTTCLSPKAVLPSPDIAVLEPLHTRKDYAADKSGVSNMDEMAISVESRNIEVCTFNRNPAEFSIPEAGNIYMIESEELKYRQISPFKEVYERKRRRPSKAGPTQGQ